MLQETVDRVSPALVPPEQVYVITNARHAELAASQLPAAARGNVIGEPMGRDSAPAIGLMAALLERRIGQDAVMIVLPADHVILDPDAFRAALGIAVETAEHGYLVTVGIPPTGPDTGFGYIQRDNSTSPFRGGPEDSSGRGMDSSGRGMAYMVKQFREKPDLETAQRYVDSGEYYWNAGMFIAKVSTFRALFRRFLPDLEPIFASLVDSIGTPNQSEIFERDFSKLTKISFDYAIAEKADRVAVVPAEIGWNDVGSWARLAEVMSESADDTGSIVIGEAIMQDSANCLVFGPRKLVAMIGLEDVVVVDTPDALLVARRDQSEKVKKIVDRLATEGRGDLL